MASESPSRLLPALARRPKDIRTNRSLRLLRVLSNFAQRPEQTASDECPGPAGPRSRRPADRRTGAPALRSDRVREDACDRRKGRDRGVRRHIRQDGFALPAAPRRAGLAMNGRRAACRPTGALLGPQRALGSGLQVGPSLLASIGKGARRWLHTNGSRSTRR